MRIISTSFKFVRSKSLPVIVALLLYVLPNLVLDVHRVFGHSNISYPSQANTAKSIQPTAEKCPVCVFEFSSTDEISANHYQAVLSFVIRISSLETSHQTTLKVFDYSQLRAPPVS